MVWLFWDGLICVWLLGRWVVAEWAGLLVNGVGWCYKMGKVNGLGS